MLNVVFCGRFSDASEQIWQTAQLELPVQDDWHTVADMVTLWSEQHVVFAQTLQHSGNLMAINQQMLSWEEGLDTDLSNVQELAFMSALSGG